MAAAHLLPRTEGCSTVCWPTVRSRWRTSASPTAAWGISAPKAPRWWRTIAHRQQMRKHILIMPRWHCTAAVPPFLACTPVNENAARFFKCQLVYSSLKKMYYMELFDYINLYKNTKLKTIGSIFNKYVIYYSILMLKQL